MKGKYPFAASPPAGSDRPVTTLLVEDGGRFLQLIVEAGPVPPRRRRRQNGKICPPMGYWDMFRARTTPRGNA